MVERDTTRARTALIAWALVLASGGCSSGDAGDARYLRRFVPHPTDWERVSQEPGRPEGQMMEIWEVSGYAPGTPPSPEQQRAADALIESCERAVEKHGWEDFQKGLADGFRLLTNDRGGHYYHLGYVTDDVVLDPERPEFLMYYETPGGMRLVGFMFYVAELMDRGPQIGGPLTIWHYHVFPQPVCILGLRKRAPSDAPGAPGRCALGDPIQRGHEMLHVWLIDHPLGPFGTRMYVPPDELAEALARRDRVLEARRAD